MPSHLIINPLRISLQILINLNLKRPNIIIQMMPNNNFPLNKFLHLSLNILKLPSSSQLFRSNSCDLSTKIHHSIFRLNKLIHYNISLNIHYRNSCQRVFVRDSSYHLTVNSNYLFLCNLRSLSLLSTVILRVCASVTRSRGSLVWGLE